MSSREPETWLRGWLLAEIRGDGNAFLQAAWEQELDLRQVKHLPNGLQAAVSLSQAGALRRAAGASRCRVKLRRRGLPFFFAALVKRPLLPLTAALFVVALCFVCSLIATVAVESVGGEALSRQESSRILALSQEAGLSPGVSLWYINLRQVEDYIQRQFPQLYYVKVEREGNQLTVQVARRSDVPEGLAQLPPGDVIAATDGLIEEILILRGTAAVAPGDRVQAGQVLVYGYQGQQAVAAAALIRGQVQVQTSGACPLRRQIIRETGESRYQIWLGVESRGQLRIFGPAASPWPLCWRQSQSHRLSLWRNNPLAVEIVVSKLCRLQSTPVEYSPEQALELAAEKALLAAQALLLQEQSWAALTVGAPETLSAQIVEEEAQVELQLTARAQLGVFVANDRSGTIPPPAWQEESRE